MEISDLDVSRINRAFLPTQEIQDPQLFGGRREGIEYPAVHEVFRGETVWQCNVEVFDLHGRPKAKCAYDESAV